MGFCNCVSSIGNSYGGICGHFSKTMEGAFMMNFELTVGVKDA